MANTTTEGGRALNWVRASLRNAVKLFGWLVEVESCFLHGNGNGFDIVRKGVERGRVTVSVDSHDPSLRTI